MSNITPVSQSLLIPTNTSSNDNYDAINDKESVSGGGLTGAVHAQPQATPSAVVSVCPQPLPLFRQVVAPSIHVEPIILNNQLVAYRSTTISALPGAVLPTGSTQSSSGTIITPAPGGIYPFNPIVNCPGLEHWLLSQLQPQNTSNYSCQSGLEVISSEKPTLDTNTSSTEPPYNLQLSQSLKTHFLEHIQQDRDQHLLTIEKNYCSSKPNEMLSAPVTQLNAGMSLNQISHQDQPPSGDLVFGKYANDTFIEQHPVHLGSSFASTLPAIVSNDATSVNTIIGTSPPEVRDGSSDIVIRRFLFSESASPEQFQAKLFLISFLADITGKNVDELVTPLSNGDKNLVSGASSHLGTDISSSDESLMQAVAQLLQSRTVDLNELIAALSSFRDQTSEESIAQACSAISSSFCEILAGASLNQSQLNASMKAMYQQTLAQVDGSIHPGEFVQPVSGQEISTSMPLPVIPSGVTQKPISADYAHSSTTPTPNLVAIVAPYKPDETAEPSDSDIGIASTAPLSVHNVSSLESSYNSIELQSLCSAAPPDNQLMDSGPHNRYYNQRYNKQDRRGMSQHKLVHQRLTHAHTSLSSSTSSLPNLFATKPNSLSYPDAAAEIPASFAYESNTELSRHPGFPQHTSGHYNIRHAPPNVHNYQNPQYRPHHQHYQLRQHFPATYGSHPIRVTSSAIHLPGAPYKTEPPPQYPLTATTTAAFSTVISVAATVTISLPTSQGTYSVAGTLSGSQQQHDSYRGGIRQYPSRYRVVPKKTGPPGAQARNVTGYPGGNRLYNQSLHRKHHPNATSAPVTISGVAVTQETHNFENHIGVLDPDPNLYTPTTEHDPQQSSTNTVATFEPTVPPPLVPGILSDTVPLYACGSFDTIRNIMFPPQGASSTVGPPLPSFMIPPPPGNAYNSVAGNLPVASQAGQVMKHNSYSMQLVVTNTEPLAGNPIPLNNLNHLEQQQIMSLPCKSGNSNTSHPSQQLQQVSSMESSESGRVNEVGPMESDASKVPGQVPMTASYAKAVMARPSDRSSTKSEPVSRRSTLRESTSVKDRLSSIVSLEGTKVSESNRTRTNPLATVSDERSVDRAMTKDDCGLLLSIHARNPGNMGTELGINGQDTCIGTDDSTDESDVFMSSVEVEDESGQISTATKSATTKTSSSDLQIVTEVCECVSELVNWVDLGLSSVPPPCERSNIRHKNMHKLCQRQNSNGRHVTSISTAVETNAVPACPRQRSPASFWSAFPKDVLFRTRNQAASAKKAGSVGVPETNGICTALPSNRSGFCRSVSCNNAPTYSAVASGIACYRGGAGDNGGNSSNTEDPVTPASAVIAAVEYAQRTRVDSLENVVERYNRSSSHSGDFTNDINGIAKFVEEVVTTTETPEGQHTTLKTTGVVERDFSFTKTENAFCEVNLYEYFGRVHARSKLIGLVAAKNEWDKQNSSKDILCVEQKVSDADINDGEAVSTSTSSVSQSGNRESGDTVSTCTTVHMVPQTRRGSVVKTPLISLTAASEQTTYASPAITPSHRQPLLHHGPPHQYNNRTSRISKPITGPMSPVVSVVHNRPGGSTVVLDNTWGTAKFNRFASPPALHTTASLRNLAVSTMPGGRGSYGARLAAAAQYKMKLQQQRQPLIPSLPRFQDFLNSMASVKAGMKTEGGKDDQSGIIAVQNSYKHTEALVTCLSECKLVSKGQDDTNFKDHLSEGMKGSVNYNTNNNSQLTLGKQSVVPNTENKPRYRTIESSKSKVSYRGPVDATNGIPRKSGAYSNRSVKYGSGTSKNNNENNARYYSGDQPNSGKQTTRFVVSADSDRVKDGLTSESGLPQQMATRSASVGTCVVQSDELVPSSANSIAEESGALLDLVKSDSGGHRSWLDDWKPTLDTPEMGLVSNEPGDDANSGSIDATLDRTLLDEISGPRVTAVPVPEKAGQRRNIDVMTCRQEVGVLTANNNKNNSVETLVDEEEASVRQHQNLELADHSHCQEAILSQAISNVHGMDGQAGSTLGYERALSCGVSSNGSSSKGGQQGVELSSMGSLSPFDEELCCVDSGYASETGLQQAGNNNPGGLRYPHQAMTRSMSQQQLVPHPQHQQNHHRHHHNNPLTHQHIHEQGHPQMRQPLGTLPNESWLRQRLPANDVPPTLQQQQGGGLGGPMLGFPKLVPFSQHTSSFEHGSVATQHPMICFSTGYGGYPAHHHNDYSTVASSINPATVAMPAATLSSTGSIPSIYSTIAQLPQLHSLPNSNNKSIGNNNNNNNNNMNSFTPGSLFLVQDHSAFGTASANNLSQVHPPGPQSTPSTSDKPSSCSTTAVMGSINPTRHLASTEDHVAAYGAPELLQPKHFTMLSQLHILVSEVYPLPMDMVGVNTPDISLLIPIMMDVLQVINPHQNQDYSIDQPNHSYQEYQLHSFPRPDPTSTASTIGPGMTHGSLSCPAFPSEDQHVTYPFATFHAHPYLPTTPRGLPLILSYPPAYPYNLFPKQLISELTKEIMNHYNEERQTESIFEQKMKLCDVLEHEIQSILEMECHLYVVGSSLNGFGSCTSDMDICLLFKKELNLHRALPLEHLSQIRKKLLEHELVSDAYLIAAKVPILRIAFHAPYEGIVVDLNVNNPVGIKNTHLLYYYSKWDSRVSPLVLIVKEWARKQDINDASRSTFSSYSLELMVIHYLQYGLQNQPVLPCLQKHYPNKFNPKCPIDQLSTEEALPPIPEASWRGKQNKMSVGDLLIGFLHYYNYFFRPDADCVSVRVGCTIPKENAQFNNIHQNNAHMWKCMCIEEPFTLLNTARSVFDERIYRQTRLKLYYSFIALLINPKLDNIMVPFPIEDENTVNGKYS